ncbi:MAG: type II secretion system F family protein [Anaerolineaceae bacterium]|nr:MAG: type II secretion system F family protein [Anaerolineaceae bacterium]
MQPVIMSFVSFALLLAGVSFFVLGMNSFSVNELAQRLNDYVSQEAGARKSRSSLISRRSELSGSFRTRVISPLIKRLSLIIGKLTPGELSANVERELAIAGNPMGLGPREFYGIRFLFSLLGIWLAFQILQGNILQFGSSSRDSVFSLTSARSSINLTTLIASVISLFVVSNLPKTWLRRMVRKRRDSIRKGLPDALDMLSVCADAGLGFDQSLQRVSEYWKTPLGAEFSRVVAEISMGVPRQTALRNLADRVDVPELSSFVAVILQSDQLGMSITDTLHAQAKQMRIERRFRAQEQARKMPLKMLFPLLLLIFPAMLAVILGPMIPVMGELFTMLLSSGR